MTTGRTTTIAARAKWIAALALLGGCGSAVRASSPDGGAAPGVAVTAANAPAAAGAAPGAPATATGAPATAPPTVRIVFTTVPMTKATVTWGKKRLGVMAPRHPLVVERPRDSGPLDVVVRAEGCLPVQTRAYTFADNKVAVKVTPQDQKNTLLGYREEVPQDGGVPEGGLPIQARGPDGGVR